jgi:hypothetical protein
MNKRPLIEEQYKKGADVINYVVYKSTTGAGNDEVLQHKLLGTNETPHVTLHPDGSVNFRIKRAKTFLENAIWTNLSGYSPAPSEGAKRLIQKLISKI